MARTLAALDKDVNAKLDYLFDWSAQMDADSDAIASATVSAPAGISLGSPVVTASTVQVYVSGGTEGTTYAIVNHIWTTGSREDDKVLNLTIIQQPSTSHTFEAETGSGSTTSNSYATVAHANTYHSSHLYGDSWHQANDSKKEKALMWATRLLDEWIAWHGTKGDEDQALQWPRVGATDRGGYSIDHDVIPSDVRNATAEFARLLIVQDRTALDEDDVPRGFKKLQAGSLVMEFDSGSRADKKDVIPEHVRRMVSAVGAPVGGPTIKMLRA
jgi:hypothetical protein